MEQSLDTQSFIQAKKTENLLLLCPYCTIRIPIFSLIQFQGELALKIRCICSNDERQIDLNAYFRSIESIMIKKNQSKENPIDIEREQCEKDEINNNTITNDTVLCFPINLIKELIQNTKCNTHDQPYAFYNQKTKNNICLQCKSKESSSNNEYVSIKNIINITSIENNCKQIDIIMNNTLNLINSFIKSTEKAAKEHKITQLIHEKIQKDIETTFHKHEELNLLLKLLYKSFHYTILSLQKYPCYEIIHFYNTVKVNSKEFIYKESNSSIEDNLIRYVSTEHVVIQREQYVCANTLSEHTLPVWSLKLINKNILASASYDTTVKLWDLSSFKCTSTLSEHTSAIFCLINCENDQLISCSADRTIKIWNTAMSKCNTTLTGYKHWIYCMIKLSDNQLASGEYDGTINIWSLKTFQCNRTIGTHLESVLCLAEMSNDRIASGSRDSSIKVWSLKTDSCISIIEAHTQSVCCIAIVDGNSLVSGSSDALIKIWHLETYKLNKTLAQHKNTVWCLLPLSNHRFASGSDDRTIKIWNINNFNCVSTLNDHYGGVCTLIIINDNQIASGSRDFSIKIWNI